MKHVYNYCAGPSMLPESVLEKAQAALLNFDNRGYSILEMNHRCKEFDAIIQDCIDRIRDLMDIPENYKILLMSGSTSMHFAMIPMNFAQGKKAGYIMSSLWSDRAYKEALNVCDAHIVATSKDSGYRTLPTVEPITEDYAYVHITTNGTTEGNMWRDLPDTNGIPLIADACSNIMAFPYDIRDFAMVYAGVQKNLGAAGLTVCIIRDDLFDANVKVPTIFNYQTFVDWNSIYNTPNVFGIYVFDLMLDWITQQGGPKNLYLENLKKSSLIYDLIDASSFYHSPIQVKDRSIVNIIFSTNDDALDLLFVKEAKEAGLINTKGHATQGGLRVSLYNAMPYEGAVVLHKFMQDFESKYAKK